MKKIMFAATFLVAFATATFANGGDADKKLLSALKAALKNAGNAQWTSKETYSKAVFTMNREKIEAFFDLDDKLIGFSRKIDVNTLPQKSLEQIKSKLGNCEIRDAIMFMDASGYIDYYAGAWSKKGYTAYKILSKGRVQQTTTIPSE